MPGCKSVDKFFFAEPRPVINEKGDTVMKRDFSMTAKLVI